MSGLLLLGGTAGVLLGLLFYGGLWLTVMNLGSSRHPVLLALGSYWLRTLAVAGAAVYFAERYWLSAVAMLGGLLLGRVLMNVWTRDKAGAARCI